jgi:hypothetical protein
MDAKIPHKSAHSEAGLHAGTPTPAAQMHTTTPRTSLFASPLYQYRFTPQRTDANPTDANRTVVQAVVVKEEEPSTDVPVSSVLQQSARSPQSATFRAVAASAHKPIDPDSEQFDGARGINKEWLKNRKMEAQRRRYDGLQGTNHRAYIPPFTHVLYACTYIHAHSVIYHV